MKLYIMRHGETDWNKEGLIQGSTDIPLNEYGVELAKRTKAGLDGDGICFDRIYSSPLQRAHETAKILAGESGVPILLTDQIREMGFGAYEGCRIRELSTKPEYHAISLCFDDPEHYVPVGGAESYEEVFARINGFLHDELLPLEARCDKVLVVCHGAVIRTFLSIIKGLPLCEYWNIHQPNCSVNIVGVEGGALRMLEENRLYYEPILDAKRGFA